MKMKKNINFKPPYTFEHGIKEYVEYKLNEKKTSDIKFP